MKIRWWDERGRKDRLAHAEAESGAGRPLASDEALFLRWIAPVVVLPWMYAVMPARLYRSQQWPVEMLHVADEPIADPSEINGTLEELRARGFARLGHARLAGNGNVVTAAMGNVERGILCIATYVTNEQVGALGTLMLHTTWSDGSRTVTWTGPYESTNAPPGTHAVWIRDVATVSELLDIHEWHCEQRASSARRTTEWSAAPFALLSSGIERGRQAAIAEGRLTLSHDGKSMRLTPKGALLAAWTRLFPYRHVREWLAAREGARLKAELNTA
jgi:hypothetical protein